MSNRLFVYGSLLSAFSNQESIRLKGENIYLGPAYIKGFLFEIDGYPGAIPDPAAGYKITGELYWISDLEKTLTGWTAMKRLIFNITRIRNISASWFPFITENGLSVAGCTNF